jgi:hypothetical protein
MLGSQFPQISFNCINFVFVNAPPAGMHCDTRCFSKLVEERLPKCFAHLVKVCCCCCCCCCCCRRRRRLHSFHHLLKRTSQLDIPLQPIITIWFMSLFVHVLPLQLLEVQTPVPKPQTSKQKLTPLNPHPQPLIPNPSNRLTPRAAHVGYLLFRRPQDPFQVPSSPQLSNKQIVQFSSHACPNLCSSFAKPQFSVKLRPETLTHFAGSDFPSSNAKNAQYSK